MIRKTKSTQSIKRKYYKEVIEPESFKKDPFKDKLRVLLIAYDSGTYMTFFPQGLAYIARVLEDDGYDVEIYNQDLHHYPVDHLTNYLNKNKFDVVGMGVIGGYWQFKMMCNISNAINKSTIRPFYVIAGYGPSPEPKYFLEKTGADVCVIGEGEDTVRELIGCIANNNPWSDINGIAYFHGSNFKMNPPRALIKDIHTIPLPAFHKFPVEIYRLRRAEHAGSRDFVMPVLSGRGCTFKCNFCYRMDMGHRKRAPESIVQEIEFLKKDYGITYIIFNDDLLMISKEATFEICEALIKANLNIKWWCNARLNYATLEVLSIMKRAGCVFNNYGIESFDNATLKVMKKGLTEKMIVEGVRNTYKSGISPGLNIIWGNKGETIEVLNKSVNFLLKYDDGTQMRTIRPVTPYPGSPLYFDAINMGFLDKKNPAKDFYENKHVNSDLLSVNFTNLSDDQFYDALEKANIRLLQNYFNNKRTAYIEQTQNLYRTKDTSFRGFRTTSSKSGGEGIVTTKRNKKLEGRNKGSMALDPDDL